MSAFEIYASILITVYMIYYVFAIRWGLKHPKTKGKEEYDPKVAFGFIKRYVRERSIIDGSFFITENSNQYSLNDEFNYDDNIPESFGDEECDSIATAVDDISDETLDEEVLPTDADLEYSQKLTEHSYEEEYNSEVFALVLSQPVQQQSRIKRLVLRKTETDIPSVSGPSDIDYDNWLQYSFIDFAFDKEFFHFQIRLHINDYMYTANMDGQDIRDCMAVYEDGGLSSDIYLWQKRKNLAVKYFRDVILKENNMVDSRLSYGYGSLENGYLVRTPPLEIDPREIRVPELWFVIIECRVRRAGETDYRIYAHIRESDERRGSHYNAMITNEDARLYLERDEEGEYLKIISPEQLMVKYLLRDIEKSYPKRGNLIKVEEEYVPTGVEPVFGVAYGLKLTEDIMNEAFTGETQIFYDRKKFKYYIDTWIYGFHRSAQIEYRFAESVIEHDENYEFTHNVTPEDVAVYYFGHEFSYMKNGCIPESDTELVKPVNTVWSHYAEVLREPYIPLMNYVSIDYPETDYLSILKIKTDQIVIQRDRSNSYSVRFTIGNWYYEFDLSPNDVCTYLERDRYGKFTRRVSKEHIASKYAKKFVGIVKMFEAGVPKSVIKREIDMTEWNINKVLEPLKVKKPRTHLSLLSDKDKADIKEKFKFGTGLTVLKESYGLPEYATLYKILGNSAVGCNSVYPDEFEKYFRQEMVVPDISPIMPENKQDDYSLPEGLEMKDIYVSCNITTMVYSVCVKSNNNIYSAPFDQDDTNKFGQGWISKEEHDRILRMLVVKHLYELANKDGMFLHVHEGTNKNV